MDKQEGHEITCYKITQNNSTSSSEEDFEIENSSMPIGAAYQQAYPIHEEYKLQEARTKFSSHTNAYCDEFLGELKSSKMDNLKKLEKHGVFLHRSELGVDRLKKRCMAYSERSFKFLSEARFQLKLLNKDCHRIETEVNQFQEELNELLREI